MTDSTTISNAKFAGPFDISGFVKVKAKRPPKTSPKPFEDHFVNLDNVIEIGDEYMILRDGWVLCLEEGAYNYLREFIMMASLRKEGFCSW